MLPAVNSLSMYSFSPRAEPFPISDDGETPFCTRACLRNATNEKKSRSLVLCILKLSGWSVSLCRDYDGILPRSEFYYPRVRLPSRAVLKI
jgi:hypothetical protein